MISSLSELLKVNLDALYFSGLSLFHFSFIVQFSYFLLWIRKYNIILYVIISTQGTSRRVLWYQKVCKEISLTLRSCKYSETPDNIWIKYSVIIPLPYILDIVYILLSEIC